MQPDEDDLLPVGLSVKAVAHDELERHPTVDGEWIFAFRYNRRAGCVLWRSGKDCLANHLAPVAGIEREQRNSRSDDLHRGRVFLTRNKRERWCRFVELETAGRGKKHASFRAFQADFGGEKSVFLELHDARFQRKNVRLGSKLRSCDNMKSKS